MSYLKPSQVAVVLSVSGQTIRNLIAKGDLTGVRIGNQLRIEEQEVTRYIKANTNNQNTNTIEGEANV